MEIPKINIINLQTRIDRRDHIIAEFKKQKIKSYEFWPGIVTNPSFVAIQKAHKQIVRDAKRNNIEYVCICEDDLVWSCDGAYEYFISNIPKDFSLYLGSIYWGEINQYNVVSDFASLTLYIIHSRYYDTFLSTPEDGNLDRKQKERGRFVVCNPFVCWQLDGFSDNVKHETDYFNTYMKGRNFYARSVAENNALIATSS